MTNRFDVFFQGFFNRFDCTGSRHWVNSPDTGLAKSRLAKNASIQPSHYELLSRQSKVQ